MAARWSVRGYEGSNQPQPDRIQEYDGFDAKQASGIPPEPLKHMMAMTERSTSRTTCEFAEVVDLDHTIVVDNGLPTEYRKFLTVAASERRGK